MVVTLVILLVLVSLLLAGAVFVAYRFYRRAVIYDEVFQFIYGDIELNLRQFQKMKTSAVTSNEPEIETAHRNMMVMGKRLNEILSRMEEASGLNLRPPVAPPRPKVVG
jgi:hypothetical protein